MLRHPHLTSTFPVTGSAVRGFAVTDHVMINQCVVKSVLFILLLLKVLRLGIAGCRLMVWKKKYTFTL